MKVTLTWPIGKHVPNDTVDVDERLGLVLVREGFARRSDGEVPPEPEPLTVAEIQAYARENGCSTRDARDRLTNERRSRLA